MILAALLVASAAGPGVCSGYYAIVKDEGVPFSLQIKPGTVRMVQMDYGGFEVAYAAQADGSLRFRSNESDRASWHLTCNGNTATVEIAHPGAWIEHYTLMRTRTDIWGVTKAKGWPIGD